MSVRFTATTGSLTPQGCLVPPSGDRARYPDRFVLVRPGQVMPPHAVQELARDVRDADVKLASDGLRREGKE